MIDGPFRARLPHYVGPLVSMYSRLGLTPNVISLLALAIAVAAAIAVGLGHALLALVLWWLGRLFDGTDGIFARTTGQATGFGAYLDIVCDMAAYSVMMVGFAMAQPPLSIYCLVIVVLYVLCITSALALGSLEERLGEGAADNRGLRLGAGLAEGGETGIAYSLFLLFPAALEVLMAAWIAILLLTVIARSLLARRLAAGR